MEESTKNYKIYKIKKIPKRVKWGLNRIRFQIDRALKDPMIKEVFDGFSTNDVPIFVNDYLKEHRDAIKHKSIFRAALIYDLCKKLYGKDGFGIPINTKTIMGASIKENKVLIKKFAKDVCTVLDKEYEGNGKLIFKKDKNEEWFVIAPK